MSGRIWMCKGCGIEYHAPNLSLNATQTCQHSWAATIDSRDAEIAALREELAVARWGPPQGDNHHNGLVCPYCNPEGADSVVEGLRGQAARALTRAAAADGERDRAMAVVAAARRADESVALTLAVLGKTYADFHSGGAEYAALHEALAAFDP